MRRTGPVLLTACGILILRASLLPLCAQPTAAAASIPSAAPRHVQRESPWYIIVDGGEAQNAATALLADRVIARLADAGFSSADLGGRKVVIRLSEEAAAVPRLYAGDGETVLSLPAGLAAGNPGEAARLLVRAYCHRLARAHAREGAPAPWLVAALAEEALAAGNISAVEAAARFALRDGLADLEILETGFATDTPAGRRASFWLYRALRRDARDRTALAAEAMCGMSVRDLRGRFLPEVAGDDARALWWPVAFHRLTAERADALSGSDASERRYAELNRFVIAEAAGDMPLTDSGLIARRATPALRDAVAARLLTLKFELLRVNPLWGNAYVARGLFWEKLAEAKTDAATLRRLAAEADAEARAASALGAEARRFVAR